MASSPGLFSHLQCSNISEVLMGPAVRQRIRMNLIGVTQWDCGRRVGGLASLSEIAFGLLYSSTSFDSSCRQYEIYCTNLLLCSSRFQLLTHCLSLF